MFSIEEFTDDIVDIPKHDYYTVKEALGKDSYTIFAGKQNRIIAKNILHHAVRKNRDVELMCICRTSQFENALDEEFGFSNVGIHSQIKERTYYVYNIEYMKILLGNMFFKAHLRDFFYSDKMKFFFIDVGIPDDCYEALNNTLKEYSDINHFIILRNEYEY